MRPKIARLPGDRRPQDGARSCLAAPPASPDHRLTNARQDLTRASAALAGFNLGGNAAQTWSSRFLRGTQWDSIEQCYEWQETIRGQWITAGSRVKENGIEIYACLRSSSCTGSDLRVREYSTIGDLNYEMRLDAYGWNDTSSAQKRMFGWVPSVSTWRLPTGPNHWQSQAPADALGHKNHWTNYQYSPSTSGPLAILDLPRPPPRAPPSHLRCRARLRGSAGVQVPAAHRGARHRLRGGGPA